jgi:hypothetical protein
MLKSVWKFISRQVDTIKPLIHVWLWGDTASDDTHFDSSLNISSESSCTAVQTKDITCEGIIVSVRVISFNILVRRQNRKTMTSVQVVEREVTSTFGLVFPVTPKKSFNRQKKMLPYCHQLRFCLLL